MRNQKGFTLVEGLLIFAVIGVIGLVGWFVYSRNSADESNSLETSAESDKQADVIENTEEELNTEETTNAPTSASKPGEESSTEAKLFEPVTGSDFGDFGNIHNKPEAQHPNELLMMGENIVQNYYQGVAYITGDGTYRVLVGYLEDVKPGEVRLKDAFEMQGINSESPQLSLAAAEPSTVDLNTTQIAYWANLSESNQIVKAIEQYKKNSPQTTTVQ